MSTRVVRSVSDFARHGIDIEVLCYCGHRATLPWMPVVHRFIDRGWSRSLDAALGRFRCTKCGGAARSIGPLPR